jgi:hypothetical protein
MDKQSGGDGPLDLERDRFRGDGRVVGSSVKMGMTSFATVPCRAEMRSSAVKPSPMYSRTYRPTATASPTG